MAPLMERIKLAEWCVTSRCDGIPVVERDLQQFEDLSKEGSEAACRVEAGPVLHHDHRLALLQANVDGRRCKRTPSTQSYPASGQRRRQTLQTHTKYTVLPCFRPTSTADAANAHQVHSLTLLQANVDGRRCKRTPSTQSYPASGQRRRQTLQTHTKYTVLPCFRPTSTADAANAHQVHSLTLLQANVDGRRCKRTPSTQSCPASGQHRRQTLQTHTKYTVLPCFRPTSTADAANAHQVHSLALLQANVDGRRCKRAPSTQSYPASGQRRRQTLQTHTKYTVLPCLRPTSTADAANAHQACRTHNYTQCRSERNYNQR